MYRHATHVRGCDTSRGGDAQRDIMIFEILDVLVDDVCLARTSWSSDEDIPAHLENIECLRLSHRFMEYSRKATITD